jgi:hypothetical protein
VREGREVQEETVRGTKKDRERQTDREAVAEITDRERQTDREAVAGRDRAIKGERGRERKRERESARARARQEGRGGGREGRTERRNLARVGRAYF